VHTENGEFRSARRAESYWCYPPKAPQKLHVKRHWLFFERVDRTPGRGRGFTKLSNRDVTICGAEQHAALFRL
jgi:hypothetical protein